ncbi:hypothetical protein DESC_480038 [Desulfosarcina cetonica]|nr:hypothetical protein DESC_240003 [Desulfosarcina cetonica]VTR66328.1 hypothetical protein DESC_480038 [Desulfosarcina cetonica]
MHFLRDKRPSLCYEKSAKGGFHARIDGAATILWSRVQHWGGVADPGSGGHLWRNQPK